MHDSLIHYKFLINSQISTLIYVYTYIYDDKDIDQVFNGPPEARSEFEVMLLH